MPDSPYLRDDRRLADVIAAIQTMGTYKYYKLGFAEWSDRINGDEKQAEHWKKVFEEHPEFFRLDSPRKKASLVWRRQHQKLFDIDSEEKISRADYQVLSVEKKARISRTPLNSDELATLLDAAINLHSRALERKRETRWWVAGTFGLAGVILGALVKAWSE